MINTRYISLGIFAENDNFLWLIVNLQLFVLKDKAKNTFLFDLKIAQYRYFVIFSEKSIIQYYFATLRGRGKGFYLENVEKKLD